MGTLQNRREFLKTVLIAGSMAPWAFGRKAWGFNQGADGAAKITYRYSTLPVERFPQLQEDVDSLRRAGKLSHNKTYRSYIDRLHFAVPDDFKEARSIVIMALFTPMMAANFHLDGRTHRVVIPPQYYDDGVTIEALKTIVTKEILLEPSRRVERAKGIHLKLTAVRSGLGRYGRNNICFVPGMGTYITLVGFLTDYSFPKDPWTERAMMDECRDCSICYGICPTGAIRREEFVIDAGRCISLYNEVAGNFPNWVLPGMHDALMGCMRCQIRCPVNEKVLHSSGNMEEVTEEETRRILSGKPDEGLLVSLERKLKGYSAASKDAFPIFTRNLHALIR